MEHIINVQPELIRLKGTNLSWFVSTIPWREHFRSAPCRPLTTYHKEPTKQTVVVPTKAAPVDRMFAAHMYTAFAHRLRFHPSRDIPTSGRALADAPQFARTQARKLATPAYQQWPQQTHRSERAGATADLDMRLAKVLVAVMDGILDGSQCAKRAPALLAAVSFPWWSSLEHASRPISSKQ